ncbi:MAG: methyltransferase domain-containing protein [Treponema sp.]|nr:methyltransferase domain-containing protein [Treponema sp.]
MNQGQILIVPSFEPGRGGGHLCRCITLVNDLRAMNKKAFLVLSAKTEDVENIFNSMSFDPQWRITDEDVRRVAADGVDFIILDRYKTQDDELPRWKEIAPVIGIDEGGKSRDSFDFLIDILIPEKLSRPRANIIDPALLKFPAKPLMAKKAEGGILKVLVAFGQEDSANLGVTVAQALSGINKSNLDITLLKGSLAKKITETFPNVRVIEKIPQLSEHLDEYDLVITHYGITAYEALYNHTTVLLVPPTDHHAKLAGTAGFISIKKLFLLKILLIKFFFKIMKKKSETLAEWYRLREGNRLAVLCGELDPKVSRRCPVCGEKEPPNSVQRQRERTYRRCTNCGIIYMDRTCPPPFEYTREYFYETYAQQYGKTYLEDFPNIKAVGKRRLKRIKSYLPPLGEEEIRKLLDIGCAYGPFLSAAADEGFSVSGIDPWEGAVNYVNEELHIPAVQGFFGDCPYPADPPFDVITLWLVLEHFPDCKAALAKIKDILKPGGILAFSTPSFSGISGRKSIGKFLEASPADHWTVWSPSVCKKNLERMGFKVKKIIITGHHPERFPAFGKMAKKSKGIAYLLLLLISKLFGLGDTFEVYAEKK